MNDIPLQRDNDDAAGEPARRRARYPTYVGPASCGQFIDRARLQPEELEQPLRWRWRRMIPAGRRGDLFHETAPGDEIAGVFAVMALAARHTFQVPTRRLARMRALLRDASFGEPVAEHATDLMASRPWQLDLGDQGAGEAGLGGRWTTTIAPDGGRLLWPPWPLPNVWLGVPIQDQERADNRIPALLDTPAAVRQRGALARPVELRRWLPLQTGQQFGSQVTLDDQVGENRFKEGDRVGCTPDAPGTHRLPTTPFKSGMVPAHIAACNGLGEPLDDLSGGAIDRQADAASAVRASTDVEVPLAVEHAREVAEHGGICGHHDRRCGTDAALSPPGDAGRVEPTPDRSPADSIAGGEFIDGRSSSIRRSDLLNMGDLAQRHSPHSPTINWLIVGGEYGRGARRMNLEWVERMVADCQAAQVPVFVSRLGTVTGREWHAGPKGADPARWPGGLRVREYPRPQQAAPVSRAGLPLPESS
jgi:protein gp37